MTNTRRGWLVVAVGVGALILLAVFLAIDVSTGADPSDPGWGDIAYIVSPFLAIAAALVIGLALMVVSAIRWIDLRVGRAAGAMIVGLVGGPVIYLVALIAASSAIDAAQSVGVLAFVTTIFPAICGIGVTLIVALVLSRRYHRA